MDFAQNRATACTESFLRRELSHSLTRNQTNGRVGEVFCTKTSTEECTVAYAASQPQLLAPWTTTGAVGRLIYKVHG